MKRLLLVITTLLVFTVGCISIPGSSSAPLGGPSGTNRPPTAYIDSIIPSSAASGEKITFVGHGTDVDGSVVAYRWRSSINGDLSSMTTFDTKLDSGNHIIYLKVQDNNDARSDEVRSSVTVSAGGGTPPPLASLPVINSFAASPASITLGSSATLIWNVSGATSVSIDQGIGAVGVVGNTLVSPGTTTSYTLTATNSAGGITATTQVVVIGTVPVPSGLPAINSFSASPGSILVGGSSTLSWNVSGATSIALDPGVGSVNSIGSQSVSPASTISYTLTASNSTGWVSQTIVVIVSPPPVIVIKTTGTLSKIVAESGGITKQGATYTKYAGPCAGDDTTNGTRRGFLSFDISSIPVGSTILEAMLDLSAYTKDGNPTYATLEFFEVYHYQYGTYATLDSDDFNAVGKLVKGGRFSVYPFSPWKFDAKESWTSEKVIQGLVDAHRTRSQFKIQFSKLTDSDGVLDFLCFNAATLTIKYTAP